MIKIIHSLFSDEYGTMYPHFIDKQNEGGTHVFTRDEIDQMDVVTVIVSIFSDQILND